jgi:four helix bundle protein
MCVVDIYRMQLHALPPGQSYRDLIAWQKSIELVLEIYRCTNAFPRTETYGLVSQLRRAAISVPSNIAEGHERISTGQFRQFLGRALGCLMEIETQIIVAERLGYLDKEKSLQLLEHTAEVGKILNGLLRSLAARRFGPVQTLTDP